MALQEGFRMKQKGSRRTRKGHLQEGEREPVRMPGGSGRSGRFGKKHSHQDDVSRMRGYGRPGPRATGKVVTDEQGAQIVAGMLRNEPGALFIQCSLFFVSASRNAMLRAVQFFS